MTTNQPTRSEVEALVEKLEYSEGASLAQSHYEDTGHEVLVKMKKKEQYERGDFFIYYTIFYNCTKCSFSSDAGEKFKVIGKF